MLPRKSGHIALAAILFWIVLYGIGYTKLNYYHEMKDRCFQASECAQCNQVADFQCKTSVPAQPWQLVFHATRSNCYDYPDTCCKTPANRASIPAALNVSSTPFSPDPIGTANTIAADPNGLEITEQRPVQTHRTILRSKTPLYIQLQSILR